MKTFILFPLTCLGQISFAQLNYIESSTGLQIPAMEAGPTEIEFADVNADGNLDIVCIGDHGSPYIGTSEHGIMVWFGDGLGNWSVVQVGNFGYGGVALGDVNNDDLMDIGYAMHHNYSSTDFGNQLMEVALGDGTGTSWIPWDDGLGTNGETYGMFGCDFADIDNDGDLDFGSISFGCCAGVHVYRNNGDGTWTQTFGFTGGNSTLIFIFGEINGDGLVDFACGHGQSAGSVYLGDGKGGFKPGDGNLPAAGNTGRYGISLGDINDDGRDDLAYVTGSGAIKVYSCVSDGNWVNLTGSLPTSGFYGTQIADMNLDGHGDIVGFALGNIKIFTGDGTGNWTLATTITTPNSCDLAAWRAGYDFDHNGYPDVARIAEENCSWSGGQNRPRAYKETSTPQSPWIFPKFPRGGENFVAGSVRFIEWHAAVPQEEMPATMSIEISTNGVSGPWQSIISGAPNNGRFQWQIPRTLPSSKNCYLRFTLTTSNSTIRTTTLKPFSIVHTYSFIDPKPAPPRDG